MKTPAGEGGRFDNSQIGVGSDDLVPGIADGLDILSDTADRVAGRGGQRHRGNSKCKQDLFQHVLSFPERLNSELGDHNDQFPIRFPEQLRGLSTATICRAMTEPDFLLFASDAEILALWGVALLVVAGICSLMERRRLKRTQINQVGWVPWTGLFVMFAVLGGGMLAVSVPAIMQG